MNNKITLNKYKIFNFLLLIIMFLVLLSSCKTTEVNKDSSQKLKNEIDIQIEKMTLEEKVGQLFVIRPDSIDPELTPEDIEKNYSSGVKILSDKMSEDYKKYPAGGFVLFQKNIQSPEQVKTFTSQLHELGNGNLRPLIYVDEEGGIVARLANTKSFNLQKYPNMGVYSASKKQEDIFEAGKVIGGYLKEYGFDVNFAPVADVNTNPNNPIIGDRAFSSNPETAGNMCLAFLQGLNAAGIYGCLKHFPGHGNTTTDTHKGYAETTRNWNELMNCEMIPFMKGIENNVEFIMAAHITAPAIDEKNLPSTLSYKILTEKLRNEMGYKGIIITDAMEMGAIQKTYSDEESTVMAVMAGADIILMPYDYRKAFNAVVQAVKKGQLTESRIDESVRRILTVKNVLYFHSTL